jgi:hypothetical protein
LAQIDADVVRMRVRHPLAWLPPFLLGGLLACTGPNPYFHPANSGASDGGTGDMAAIDLASERQPEAPMQAGDGLVAPEVNGGAPGAVPDLGPNDPGPIADAMGPMTSSDAAINGPLDSGSDDVGSTPPADRPDVVPVVDATPETKPPGDAAGPVPGGMVGYWPLDEGAGMWAHDKTGLGNDGVLKAGTVWSSAGFPAQFANPGCLSFDGNDSEVQAPAVGLPGMGQAKTISLWAWFPNPLPAGVRKNLVVFSRNTDNTAGIQFGFDSGRPAVWLRGENTNLFVSEVLPEQKWHHLAYVFDGTLHQLYVNGILAAVSNLATAVGVADHLYFGSWGGTTQHFPGKIDDVRFYDRRLDADEVSSLAQGR